MKLDGRIKNIKTHTKAQAGGNVSHVTTVTLELNDLDMVTLERLAYVEYAKRTVIFEVELAKSHVQEVSIPADMLGIRQ